MNFSLSISLQPSGVKTPKLKKGVINLFIFIQDYMAATSRLAVEGEEIGALFSRFLRYWAPTCKYFFSKNVNYRPHKSIFVFNRNPSPPTNLPTCLRGGCPLSDPGFFLWPWNLARLPWSDLTCSLWPLQPANAGLRGGCPFSDPGFWCRKRNLTWLPRSDLTCSLWPLQPNPYDPGFFLFLWYRNQNLSSSLTWSLRPPL